MLSFNLVPNYFFVLNTIMTSLQECLTGTAESYWGSKVRMPPPQIKVMGVVTILRAIGIKEDVGTCQQQMLAHYVPGVC